MGIGVKCRFFKFYLDWHGSDLDGGYEIPIEESVITDPIKKELHARFLQANQPAARLFVEKSTLKAMR